jgi:hypothetical protein
MSIDCECHELGFAVVDDLPMMKQNCKRRRFHLLQGVARMSLLRRLRRKVPMVFKPPATLERALRRMHAMAAQPLIEWCCLGTHGQALCHPPIDFNRVPAHGPHTEPNSLRKFACLHQAVEMCALEAGTVFDFYTT